MCFFDHLMFCTLMVVWGLHVFDDLVFYVVDDPRFGTLLMI